MKYSMYQIQEALHCQKHQVKTLFRKGVLVDESPSAGKPGRHHRKVSVAQVRALARIWNGTGVLTERRTDILRQQLHGLGVPAPLFDLPGNGNNNNGHAPAPKEVVLASPPPPVQSAAVARVMVRLDELTTAVNKLTEHITELQRMWA